MCEKFLRQFTIKICYVETRNRARAVVQNSSGSPVSSVYSSSRCNFSITRGALQRQITNHHHSFCGSRHRIVDYRRDLHNSAYNSAISYPTSGISPRSALLGLLLIRINDNRECRASSHRPTDRSPASERGCRPAIDGPRAGKTGGGRVAGRLLRAMPVAEVSRR